MIKPHAFPMLLLVLLALVMTSSGCSDQRDDELFSSPSEKKDDPERMALKRDLLELSKSKDPDDLEASAKYEDAKQRLIHRGSTIEAPLTEALLGSDDWGIRLGVVEVLQAIATRRSVMPLIQVLDDVQPLVALKAEYTLREMTQHREIPPEGEPTGANGLPPVPVRDPQDLDMEAELKLWTTWHAQYKTQLRAAWSDWWEKNKDKTRID